MMFVKSANKMMIVTGTPRSHRIPALAMIFSQFIVFLVYQLPDNFRVPLQDKDLRLQPITGRALVERRDSAFKMQFAEDDMIRITALLVFAATAVC